MSFEIKKKCHLTLFRLTDNVWFPRLHPDAPVTDTALPDDGASPAHGHHPLRKYPRIPCRPSEHPQVSRKKENKLNSNSKNGWFSIKNTGFSPIFAASHWGVRSSPFRSTPLYPGTPTGWGTSAKMRTTSATPGNWWVSPKITFHTSQWHIWPPV